MYSLLVLEARSLKPMCGQGQFLLESVSWCSPSSCYCQQALVFLGLWLHCSISVSLHGTSLVSLCPDWIGPTAMTTSELEYLCKDPVSQNSRIHRWWGLGLHHIFLGDRTPPTTPFKSPTWTPSILVNNLFLSHILAYIAVWVKHQSTCLWSNSHLLILPLSCLSGLSPSTALAYPHHFPPGLVPQPPLRGPPLPLVSSSFQFVLYTAFRATFPKHWSDYLLCSKIWVVS